MSYKKNDTLGNKQMDETNLWQRFQKGDMEAWERIFYQYYEDLYAYGLQLSGSKELTKDCIHELFVTIWERRDNLSEANSIKAYLLVSLRRSLLKKIKKKKKYYDDEVDPFVHYNDVQLSPEVLIVKDERKAERLRAMYDALEKLPPRQKEVLFLKYFNGLSYDEIEEILDIKYQSIKNHVYRAISNIKETLQDNEITNIAISLLPILHALLL